MQKKQRPKAASTALLAFTVMVAGLPAQAVEVEPFALYNQSPIAQIYGFPLTRGFRVLPEAAQRLDFTLDLTSNFEAEATASESVIFDGETHRGTFIYRRGLGNNLDVSFELPILRHDGGFMDGFIDNFHDVFGFGSGGRDKTQEDQLQYRVIRNGATLLDLRNSESGVGDARLSLTRQLAGMPEGRGAAVGATLKLPTGDADRLTGSGAADIAAWATYGTDTPTSAWGWVGTVGAIYTGEGDVMPGLRRRSGLFGSVTLAYAWNERLHFKAQAYASSPLYEDSELDALDGAPVLGVLGGSWQFAPQWGLDVGVVEDLNVGATPDVSFHFALRRKL